jgi:hypothetical protein
MGLDGVATCVSCGLADTSGCPLPGRTAARFGGVRWADLLSQGWQFLSQLLYGS